MLGSSRDRGQLRNTGARLGTSLHAAATKSDDHQMLDWLTHIRRPAVSEIWLPRPKQRGITREDPTAIVGLDSGGESSCRIPPLLEQKIQRHGRA